MDILVATSRPAVWEAFLQCAQDKTYAVATVPTLDDIKTHLRTKPLVLAILDLHLEGKALTEAVIALLRINASVHLAVVSTMTEEAFHTCTEGLGILMPLPLFPKVQDAETLLEKLALVHHAHA